jgi:hypothetical protein
MGAIFGQELQSNTCAQKQASVDCSASPICTLPLDVLRVLFACVLAYDEARGRRPAHRYAFTRVCHTWRELALDTPTLWTVIDLARPNVSAACLDRASNAPRDITWSERHTAKLDQRTLAACVRTQVPHTRSLSCAWLLSGSAETALLGLDQPAPLLETLNLAIHYHLNFDVAPNDPGFFCMSNALFGGSTPRLRELILDNCAIDRTWAPYAQLCSLEIKTEQSRSHMADIAALLSATPALEYLKTHNILSMVASPSSTSAGSTVVMPNLRRWTLGDNSRAVPVLLRHIIIPTSAALIVGETYRVDTMDPASSVFSALVPHVTAVANTLAHHSRVQLGQDSKGPFVKAWRLEGEDPQPFLSIQLRTPFDSFFAAVAEYLPLAELSYLEVSDDHKVAFEDWIFAWNADTWRTVLACTPRIHTLAVHGLWAPGLCAALLKPTDEAPLLCPLLSQLTLAHVFLRHQVDPSGRTLIHLLPDVITARHAAGAPIRTLGLYGLAGGAVKVVRRFLRTVTVDIVSDAEASETDAPERWPSTDAELERMMPKPARRGPANGF